MTGASLRVSEDVEAAAVEVGGRLAAIYGEIADRSMRELPVYNPALSVEAIGFRTDGARVVGVLATPWFMNLVVARVPGGPELPPAPAGAKVTHAFPSGDFDCVVGETSGFGRLDSASLFSPMFQFDDPAVVRAVAEAALEEVFRVPAVVEPSASEPSAPPSVSPQLDRRALLFGRRRSEEDPSCR